MSRVLLAVLMILFGAQAGCRSSREDKKDTQRVEHRVGQDVWALVEWDSPMAPASPSRATISAWKTDGQGEK
jgi:hypothetical protein